MSALIDASALIGRSIRLSRRNVDTLLMAVLLPVMLMALFVYVFGGAVDPGGDYVRYVVPGIVLLCAGYGAASTAMPVADDINGGMIDRLVLHTRYRRYVRRTSKFMAHDELGATVGDKVRIVETRPLSARKSAMDWW